jgi:hypothetical protein
MQVTEIKSKMPRIKMFEGKVLGTYDEHNNIVFTYELARRLAGIGVLVNCLHPGGIASGLWTNNGPFAQFLMKAGNLKTPEQGAQTTIYLASSPEVEGLSGKYYANCREKTSNKESYDLSVARRLWDISARMTGVDGQEVGAAQPSD